jgi:hypothetical protein|tara:strand:+ start:525 stop:1124 length:600 start_codon:yes stop_codon:yes gene_type:complete
MSIDVYDNIMDQHDAQLVHDIMTDKEFLWEYYHKSDNSQNIYHWHRLAGKTEEDIVKNGFEWLIPMWNHFMYKIDFKKKYNIDTFRRIYFNAHTNGIEPKAHTDDGDFTMIYYPLLDWNEYHDGGGTIVWSDHSGQENEMPKTIEKHVSYVGNRLFVFPAKRLHQAMPVARTCFRLRSCIVFKCYLSGANDERLEFYKD